MSETHPSNPAESNTIKPLVSPIGTVYTPFNQKFAIPRQPNLANAPGTIEFHPPFDDINCLRGLEQYSHLWVLFQFHETISKGWSPTVRAPRLGGNERMGVFATRSTFRPNGIGMSVVKNLGYQRQDGKTTLNVSGVDLVNKTPILDIKPYLPYADSITDATADWINETPLPDRQVYFSDTATQQLASLGNTYPELSTLITSVLAQDPRPAYKQRIENDEKLYHVSLYQLEITWRVINGTITVASVTPS